MRGLRESAALAVLLAFAAPAFLLPPLLLGWITLRGAAAVDWDFLSRASADFGAEGGVYYQILGTGVLIAGAALAAGPLAWALAILRRVYLSRANIRRLDLALYVLNGVPSIVFGLFGYLCFVHALGLGVSWPTGSLILGLMILPTAAVAAAEGLDAVPRERIEAAEALGLLPWQVIRSVHGPASLPALATGLALGLARAAGETAPIFFTAAVFSGVDFPRSWRDPVVALPTHIFTLAQEAADPAALANAWGAALVLVALIGSFSALSWLLRARARGGMHA